MNLVNRFVCPIITILLMAALFKKSFSELWPKNQHRMREKNETGPVTKLRDDNFC